MQARLPIGETVEEVCAHIGATSLAHLSYDGLIRAIGRGAHGFCGACLTGNYPFPIPLSQTKDAFEEKREQVVGG